MEQLPDSPFLLSLPYMLGTIQKQGRKIYFELIMWKSQNRDICKLLLGNSDQAVIDWIYNFFLKEEERLYSNKQIIPALPLDRVSEEMKDE